MCADKTVPKQQIGRPFKPGQSGNPAGRPKGARSKLGEAFLEALHSDFDKHGVQAIEDARENDPTAYVRTIASLLPKEIKAEVNRRVTDMTDDELADIARLAIRSGNGASQPGGGTSDDDGLWPPDTQAGRC